ncbi:MAG TPA: Wzz/FepE/Etk N-terminal domain-containing protein [Bradyrhizobium sp.]|nr:Wzz/FepE/Etk N-terminal domain-containing protein [Bradyrhizobium sp.]
METIAIFDVLRRHAFLIASLCIVTTLAGYGVSFISPLVPEKYEASAVVLVRPHEEVKIEPNSSGKEFSDFPVAQTPIVESASKTYIQIIQSPALIGEVVRQLGLDHEPPKKKLESSAVFGWIAAPVEAIFDGAESSLKDALSIVKYGRVEKDDPFIKAMERIGKGLVLKSYEDTYVFEIRYSDKDPQVAADVANTIARLFIEFMEKMRASEAKDSAVRLDGDLEESRQRLVDARESLRKYKEAHNVFLYQPEYEQKLKVIGDLTVELAKLDATYANETLGDGTIEANTYAKKRERLVKALDDNQADIGSLPTVERELQLRQADVDVASTTYATVAKELKDAELKADALPDARLISPAGVPELPSRPRRLIIALVSLMTGLLAGIALAFSLEYMNRTARGINDIENFVGLKVIGTIPAAPRRASATRELQHFD